LISSENCRNIESEKLLTLKQPSFGEKRPKLTYTKISDLRGRRTFSSVSHDT
jgi:hypothetical protein